MFDWKLMLVIAGGIFIGHVLLLIVSKIFK